MIVQTCSFSEKLMLPKLSAKCNRLTSDHGIKKFLPTVVTVAVTVLTELILWNLWRPLDLPLKLDPKHGHSAKSNLQLHGTVLFLSFRIDRSGQTG